MKRLTQLTLLLLLICLSACKDRPYPRILATADSLTYTHPDSAITLLENWKTEMEQSPKATQMYYRLLQIKAKDKAYVPITSDSTSILRIVEYYENKKNNVHLMEAYYYAGRFYRDLGDTPQALNYFQKAIDASGNSKDYRVISRIYSQTGGLLLLQDIYDDALTAYRKAYQYNTLAKDSTGLIFNLKDIGTNYTALNNADSSLYYYKTAYALAKEINNQRCMNIVQSGLAGLYIQLKKYDEAQVALQSPLQNVERSNQSAIYSISADLYYKKGEIDSAMFYAQRTLECGTIYAKQSAHWTLAQIAVQKGDCKTAIEQIRQYNVCNDSVRKMTTTETIRKMQSVYNYQLREKENNFLKSKSAKQELFIAYGLLAIILLIALIIIYMLYSKRKKERIQAQLQKLKQLKEEQYAKSSQFIEENKKRIAALEAQLKQEKEESRQLLQIQKERLEQNITRAIAAREGDGKVEKLFNESNIYARIHEMAHNPDSKMTEEDWKELTDTIDAVYNNFTSRLYAIQHFSLLEMRINLLLKAKFPVTIIAHFCISTKSTVTSSRKAMYKKVFGVKSKPEEWDNYIASF